MWQIWTNVILGFWVILLAFLDFSSTLTTFFLIITGAALGALNFWLLSFIKTPERQHPDSEILPPAPSELEVAKFVKSKKEDETPTLDEIEVGAPTLKDAGEENETEQEPEDNSANNN